MRVLRREWEMATADLRKAAGVTDRRAFAGAMDELQAAMLVMPSAVVYRPFTYIWTLAVGRSPTLRRRVSAPSPSGDRPRVSRRRRNDRSGRARARHRPVAAGSGSGQSLVGHRRVRDDAARGVYRLGGYTSA
jgi:hypothetical protein